MASRHRRLFILPGEILHDLARCYRLFSDDYSRTFTHKSSNEQVVIASFCTLVWGIRKWQSSLHDVRELEVPSFPDKDVEVAAKDG